MMSSVQFWLLFEGRIILRKNGVVVRKTKGELTETLDDSEGCSELMLDGNRCFLGSSKLYANVG